jgi:hypothetical protein
MWEWNVRGTGEAGKTSEQEQQDWEEHFPCKYIFNVLI